MTAMGMLRKFVSVNTLGLVDFRNDSERSAAAERSKKNAYKERTKMERDMRERELALREREVAAYEHEVRMRKPFTPSKASPVKPLGQSVTDNTGWNLK